MQYRTPRFTRFHNWTPGFMDISLSNFPNRLELGGCSVAECGMTMSPSTTEHVGPFEDALPCFLPWGVTQAMDEILVMASCPPFPALLASRAQATTVSAIAPVHNAWIHSRTNSGRTMSCVPWASAGSFSEDIDL